MSEQNHNHNNPIDALCELHSQTDAMLLMMMVYVAAERDGGEQINSNALENYLGQMKANMELAQRETMKLVGMKITGR
jgi:hypothetical protein